MFPQRKILYMAATVIVAGVVLVFVFLGGGVPLSEEPPLEGPGVPQALSDAESVDTIVEEIVGQASSEGDLIGGEDDSDLLTSDGQTLDDLGQSYVESDF